MSTDAHAYDVKFVEDFVIDQIEALGVESDLISPDAALEALGLDSLDVVEISQSVRKNLGIAVQAKDFVDAFTVSEVLAVIHQRARVA